MGPWMNRTDRHDGRGPDEGEIGGTKQVRSVCIVSLSSDSFWLKLTRLIYTSLLIYIQSSAYRSSK